MESDQQRQVDCPHCGEINSINLANIAIGEENPIIDCTVCCQPMQVFTHQSPSGEIDISVRSST